MSSLRILSLIRSSSFRFALLVISMLWGAVACLLLMLYLLIRSTLLSQMEAQLDRELAFLRQELVQHGSIFSLLERWNQRPPGQRMVQFVTPEETVTISVPTEGQLFLVKDDPRWDISGAQMQLLPIIYSGGNSLIAWKELSLGSGRFIRLGLEADYLERVNNAMRTALLYGLGSTLLLAIFGSLVITRKTLVRLNLVNQTCSQIMQGDLNMRVPLSGRNDDYDILATRINDMLDQIQRLMGGIHRVSDNIAHDLKTPLTRLRSRLELLHHQASKDDIDDVIHEADRMLSIFNGLLRLSRLEAGRLIIRREPVDLVPLVTDICELYEPLAEDREQELLFNCQLVNAATQGDVDLLFQTLSNLLDNAIKYTPEQGKIQVSLTEHGPYLWCVEVLDGGPGIPEEEQSKVFDRFYRMESHRNSAGNGLGLSLVKVVAELHQAELLLQSESPGLRVRLLLHKKDSDYSS